jgi:hypothetical protein
VTGVFATDGLGLGDGLGAAEVDADGDGKVEPPSEGVEVSGAG